VDNGRITGRFNTPADFTANQFITWEFKTDDYALHHVRTHMFFIVSVEKG